jgi:hypothetical protein
MMPVVGEFEPRQRARRARVAGAQGPALPRTPIAQHERVRYQSIATPTAYPNQQISLCLFVLWRITLEIRLGCLSRHQRFAVFIGR